MYIFIRAGIQMFMQRPKSYFVCWTEP